MHAVLYTHSERVCESHVKGTRRTITVYVPLSALMTCLLSKSIASIGNLRYNGRKSAAKRMGMQRGEGLEAYSDEICACDRRRYC